MKRQALTTTIRELHKLVNELVNELFDEELKFRLDLENKTKGSLKKISNKELYKISEAVLNQRVSLNIINKTPECSDTWEIEKM